MNEYFTNADMKKLLDVKLKNEDYTTWLLCAFLWYSGLRVSEALAIKIGDIDLTNRTIKVKTLRRKDHLRDVHVPTHFAKELSRLLKNSTPKKKLIFPFNRVTAYNKVRKACRAAGIEDNRCHPSAFRHAFAAHYARRGMPVLLLKQLLGHRNVQATLFYYDGGNDIKKWIDS